MKSPHKSWFGRGRIVAALDIGTSKIACLIARVEPPLSGDSGRPAVHYLGHSYGESSGMANGQINHAGRLEETIYKAVNEANIAAGTTIDAVTVGITACGSPQSRHVTATADVGGRPVAAADLDKLHASADSYLARGGRRTIDMHVGSYRIDNAEPVSDPRGFNAQRLSADIWAVTANDNQLRELIVTIERCHLQVENIVVSASASALAVTTEDQREVGITCIDLGAGTTLLASFQGGRCTWTTTVPAGCDHIDYDITRELHIPLAKAKRIKSLYGTMARAASNDHQLISLPTASEDGSEPYQISRGHLRSIIGPRVEIMFSLIKDRISDALARGDISPEAASRVVLTGGGSQLEGLSEFATGALGRRVHQPRQLVLLPGMPPELSDPKFATLNGLLLLALQPRVSRASFVSSGLAASGYLGKVRDWLKESF